MPSLLIKRLGSCTKDWNVKNFYKVLVKNICHSKLSSFIRAMIKEVSTLSNKTKGIRVVTPSNGVVYKYTRSQLVLYITGSATQFRYVEVENVKKD